MAKSKKEVRIRMYKQGLGDCFLLTFPTKSKPFHLLLDCGALNSKAEDMQAVVRHIAEETEHHLNVLAATHEHWDHISGFHQSQAQAIFDKMNVDSVWVAWTEDPDNEAAEALKKEFKKHQSAVELALNRFPDEQKCGEHLGLYHKAITHLLGFSGGLGAAKVNRTGAAWQYVLKKALPKYCDPHAPCFDLLEGVRVYVLGPPADAAFVRKKLSTKETYDQQASGFSAFAGFLAAVSTVDQKTCDDPNLAFPFHERYYVSKESAQQNEFFQKYYGFTAQQGEEGRRIDYDWLSTAGELALHLDSYTNNTCLAFAIELIDSGQVLLFPGDAQVGNWLSWSELSWEVKDKTGAKQKVTIDDLLARTVFYKVGHHGSHNATLREKGLEKMNHEDLVVMIPVHRETAQAQGWEFPYGPLWKRLKEKARGRVLLADMQGLYEIQKEAQQRLKPAEWGAFEKATKCDPSDPYVEYRIPY